MKKHLLILCLLCFTIPTYSAIDSVKIFPKDTLQKADTATKKRVHSPTRAALFSAILPGLGQAYNKKYWKVPVVYVGLGGLIYGIVSNGKEYRNYRKAYQSIVDTDATTNFIYKGYTSANQVYTLKERYKKNMDLCIAFTGVWYALNIIDAAVDAHLTTFDISDNLTMKVQPSFYVDRLNNYNTTGQVAFSLNFKPKKQPDAYRNNWLR